MIPKERLRKDNITFTPKADPWYRERQPTTIKKKNNGKPWKRGRI